MRRDAAIAGACGDRHRIERLGDGADLVHLHQQRVADALRDAFLQDLRIGHEHIVADQLHLVAERLRSAASSRASPARRSRLRSR